MDDEMDQPIGSTNDTIETNETKRESRFPRWLLIGYGGLIALCGVLIGVASVLKLPARALNNAFYLQALRHEANGDYDAAIKSMTRAIEFEPRAISKRHYRILRGP